MADGKKKSIRTATGLNMDRGAMKRAQLPIAMKATQRQMESDMMAGKMGFGDGVKRARASQAAGAKAEKLGKDSARIQKAGARMGRAQAAAKAKRLK